MQTFTAPLNTNYKIECWGASGGDDGSYIAGIPGKGGYSKGIIPLTKAKELYVYVGEQGEKPAKVSWNGGGCGYGGSGGGGASDVRIIQHTGKMVGAE